MDFEFAQQYVRLRVSFIKPCCRQIKELAGPHGAGLQTHAVPLHLAAFRVRGQTAETLESKAMTQPSLRHS